MSDKNLSDILPIIVGTAGHVDHGKTSLVKNLTNFDTDRHPEEKQRGMSIDFAVAPYRTSNSRTVGIVDLPGHKDFLKNMTAGASSIDILLLIVAADDGIMPQTVEHLKIARYLGTTIVLPVITKIDLVDQTFLELIKDEITTLLEKENLNFTEFSLVSNLNIESINPLKVLLDKEIENFQRNFELNKNAFRMYARACFSQKGQGTVVTGVPLSGSITVGDSLELFSRKRSDKSQTIVKNIQNYRFEKTTTEANISSAINLRDSKPDSIERGSVLATPNVFKFTSSVLVWVNEISELKRGKTFTFHTGTLAEEAVAYPLNYQDNRNDFAQLYNFRFKRPIITAAGDRCIIRDENLLVGGRIISRTGFVSRRSLRDLQIDYCKQAFTALETKNDFFTSEILTSQFLILFDEDLVSFKQIAPQSFDNNDIKQYFSESLTSIGRGIWVNNSKKELLHKVLSSILTRYHREKPFSPGIQISHLLKLIRSTSKNISNFEESLVRNYLENIGPFKVANGTVTLASFQPPFSEAEAKIVSLIDKLITEKSYCAIGSLEEEHKIEKKVCEKLIKYLELSGEIKKIENFLFKHSYLETLKQDLKANFSSGFSLQEFRDHTKLSRNVATAILDYFDGAGITKRAGDKRTTS